MSYFQDKERILENLF